MSRCRILATVRISRSVVEHFNRRSVDRSSRSAWLSKLLCGRLKTNCPEGAKSPAILAITSLLRFGNQVQNAVGDDQIEVSGREADIPIVSAHE